MSKSLTQAEKAKAALDASKKVNEPTPVVVETIEVVEPIVVEVKKPKRKKGEFLNPFEAGVTYEDFLESIPAKTSVEDYCKKNKLKEDQIKWLVEDLKNYKK